MLYGCVYYCQKFLLLDEKKENSKRLSIGNSDTSISIKKVDASWVTNSTPNLHGVELHVPFKKLYAIVGSVASGKVKFNLYVLLLS